MYRQRVAGAGAEQPYHVSPHPNDPPFAQSAFAANLYGGDAGLHNQFQHLHPGARPTAAHPTAHARQSSADSTGQMSALRSVSPRIGVVNSPQSSVPSFTPADRSLPDRSVTAGDITDAFVAFILYCNPNFPLDVDTTTLQTTFQSPPKSDSKDFETFHLFELIKKFDAKEIKTWNQLALDLGVEAPDTTKGQSVQKVQQYSVRLKRWMHAMHIDAFFEYLLGKPHSYFTELPHPSDPYPAGGRDGVTAEEDLAIRALDPTFRPKRGRRRNSEVEQEENVDSARPNKQLKGAEGSTPYPQPQSGVPLSALPLSAHPDSYTDPWALASAITPQSFTPWSTRSSAAPSNLRWQSSQTPATPHPMSSIPTSMSAHIDAAFDGEPKSAVTPSTRKRRKHGPAVSSAWPSANTPGSKPRGRPPANRNVQDGPFGTFPVDPNSEKARTAMQIPTPVSGDKHVNFDPPQTTPTITSAHSEGRPSRLSLQVPPHTGGPVRLATPPRLLVNGETDDPESRVSNDAPIGATSTLSSSSSRQTGQPTGVVGSVPSEPQNFAFCFETLKRVLAGDLLRADFTGRRQRLVGEEAKRLADSILERLGVPRGTGSSLDDDIARLTAASWLGITGRLHVPAGTAAGHGKRIVVTRFRLDADGYEQVASDDNDMDPADVREVFDLTWQASLGSCMGTFELKSLTLGPVPPEVEGYHDLTLRKGLEALNKLQTPGWLDETLNQVARASVSTREPQDDGIDWRARYRALEFAAHMGKGEALRMKDRMLEKIIDAVL